MTSAIPVNYYLITEGNFVVESSLDVCLHFKLKICELNPTKCILNLGQFSTI